MVALGALPLGVSLAAALAPVVTIEDATNVTYTTAKVKGEVNPEGQSTNWRLQYSTHADFSENVNTVEEEATESIRPVEAELTNLTPGTTYYARLQAENGDGTVEDVTAAFETEAVAAPTIEGFAITAVTSEDAHFSATIDPGGADPAFDTSWHFQCIPSCGDLTGPVVEGASGTVEVDATGLEPSTFYTVRLFASNKGGEAKDTETFRTGGAGPLIKSFAAGPVQSDRVMLNGEVDPRGSSTEYWFEWGTSDCSASGSPCQSIPAERDASAGDGPYFRWVQRRLAGLQPQTTYHFRLVAANEVGTTEGPDEEFTTAAPPAPCTNQGMPGTGFLPDCRGYEMVSPPDKNGGGVVPETNKTHIRFDSNAVTFSSLGRFASVEGSGTDSEYLSQRTGSAGTNGWSTQSINPAGESTTFPALLAGNGTTFVDGFASDLSAGVYLTWRPLVKGSNVGEVSNLYRVDGLYGGVKSISLLTDSAAPLPETWFTVAEGFFARSIQPRYAGVSTDLSHVVFQSQLSLTTDSPPYEGVCAFFGSGCSNKLYENVDGTVRLVGRIPLSPDTACDDVAGPPCVAANSSDTALSAENQTYSDLAISSDGNRIFFVTPDSSAIYLREDGVRTERIAANGEFWTASADGSRAFFTTTDPLVPDDEDDASDLYMYDRDAPSSARFTLVSTGSGGSAGNVKGVLGATPDGHTVYFTFNAPLISGQQPPFQGLYCWHDGQLSYIGSFANPGEAEPNGPRTSWNSPTTTKKSRITPDGRYLLFMSTGAEWAGRGGFAGYDAAGHSEFYLYDAETGRLACATCNPAGGPATADAAIDVREAASASVRTSDFAQALTDDGHRVFFNTGEALLPSDTNGTSDAYEYDALTGEFHLLSSGTDSAPSYVIDSDHDGRNVFIATRERLVGWDTDNAYDLYDARVNGGFPEPAPKPAPCQGDSCLPVSQAAPPPSAAASEAPGAASPQPPRTCPKGRRAVRRHGKARCVKRRHRNHHKRQANHNRRAGR